MSKLLDREGRLRQTHTRLTSQLKRHLSDMAELRSRVETARDLCPRGGEDWGLFQDLVQTIDEHHNLISDRLNQIDLTGTPSA